ncbi:MAG: NUDIX hydrolase [Flavobacteriaceae bacterium]
MKFELFLKHIEAVKNTKLPGIEAQFKLAPKLRLNYNAKKIKANDPKIAAVLALFYPNQNNEVTLLLTKRANYNGTHSGQISFPGGKVEQSDLNLKQTALRETFEEVGIIDGDIEVIREFTEVYIPPSNFLVTPFIGIIYNKPVFKVNSEVAKIIEVPFSKLIDETSIGSIKITNSYMKETSVPCFKIDDSIIWGATAMVLSEIREVIKI